MFNKNLTKWIPLGNFQHAGDDLIVFVRGNRKTGEMFFKTKNANARFGLYSSCVNNFLPRGFIDVKQQWEKIIGELNSVKL